MLPPKIDLRDFDHTDTNNALCRAIRVISLEILEHRNTEETARNEARDTLNELDARQNDTAWLTDRLTQAVIDLDVTRERILLRDTRTR